MSNAHTKTLGSFAALTVAATALALAVSTKPEPPHQRSGQPSPVIAAHSTDRAPAESLAAAVSAEKAPPQPIVLSEDDPVGLQEAYGTARKAAATRLQAVYSQAIAEAEEERARLLGEHASADDVAAVDAQIDRLRRRMADSPLAVELADASR